MPIPAAILADLEYICGRLADERDGYTRDMRDLLSVIELRMLRLPRRAAAVERRFSAARSGTESALAGGLNSESLSQ